jgi:hypothetical protein
LEDLEGAKLVDKLKFADATWFDSDPTVAQEKPLWSTISSTFANSCRGSVHAMLSRWRTASVFVGDELGILRDNNVDISYHAVTSFPMDDAGASVQGFEQTAQVDGSGILTASDTVVGQADADVQSALEAWANTSVDDKRAAWANLGATDEAQEETSGTTGDTETEGSTTGETGTESTTSDTESPTTETTSETTSDGSDLLPPSHYAPPDRPPALEALGLSIESEVAFEGVLSRILEILGIGPAPVPKASVTGLASPVSLARFLSATRAAADQWPALTTAQRSGALGAAANAELGAHSVPEVKLRWPERGDKGGYFDFPVWTIEADVVAFHNPQPNQEQLGEMAELVYHEARHAEQWHRMARMKAGDGWTEAQIASNLVIPKNIAGDAARQPLTGTSTSRTEALGWFESTYGANRKKREDTMEDLNKYTAQYTTIYNQWISKHAQLARTSRMTQTDAYIGLSLEVDALKQRYNESYSLFNQANAGYRALAEEVDAWDLGARVKSGLS